MSKLPRVSGEECVKALSFVRQQGSHIVGRDDPFSQIVIPNHKELDRGTLRAILRQAEVGVSNFINLI